MTAVKFENNRLFFLDQVKLPLEEDWQECLSLKQGFEAIKQLKVRGAPLIGVFAAYCMCVELPRFSPQKEEFLNQFYSAAEYLKQSRPTAVNLFWALDRLIGVVKQYSNEDTAGIRNRILEEAKIIHEEDKLLCRRMGDYGVELVASGDRILTHCNAGSLATSGNGTAVAVIYKAWEVYKNIEVYADETRPLLQGSRLTAWELMKNKVPVTVICDNMAAVLMRQKKIDKIFTGADRIAANGDTANKIGTYSLSVLARYHKIPFYIVAPFSTFDLSISAGESIPIEQRDQEEVRTVLGKVYTAPRDVQTYNPAFDVTPHQLITAIISDRGIIYPPFQENIARMIKNEAVKVD